MKLVILEMGTGNDLYGEDYTKAACRAVDDALHHSSIILFRSLGYDHADMEVRVTVAVQAPRMWIQRLWRQNCRVARQR